MSQIGMQNLWVLLTLVSSCLGFPMKKTLLQEHIKSLFTKPLVLITLNTTENPHDGYSKFCFQGKV